MSNIWMVRSLEDWLPRGSNVDTEELNYKLTLHGLPMKPLYNRFISPHDVPAQLRVIDAEVIPFARADDLVLTVGPTLMIAVLACSLMHEFGRASLLVWDRHVGEYVPRHVQRRAR